MKKNLFLPLNLFLCSLLIVQILFANNTNIELKRPTSNDCTDCVEAAKLPYNCNINLTIEDLPATDFAIDSAGGGGNWLYYYKYPQTAAKEWLDVEYLDERCFNGEAQTFDLCTSENDEHALKELKYKVYFPIYPYSTCTQKPPAFIMFHAGGYSDCNGIENAGNIDLIAKQMAKKGFIVFSCEYRRGRATSTNIAKNNYPKFNTDINNPFETVEFITASQVLCYYRAFQDMRGAIRSIIKRNGETATPYKFNGDNIFLGGFSAGAVGSIVSAYYQTQTMINSIANGAETILGPVDANYYYGEPAIEYFSKIKGILNGWGNAFIPKEYAENLTAFFPPAMRIPLISFHGENDFDVCPYNISPVYYSPTGFISDNDEDGIFSIENPETRCLPDGATYNMAYGNDIILDNSPPPPYIGNSYYIDDWRFGSLRMYCFLKSVGVYTELYADSDMFHGIVDSLDDFGLGNSTTFNQRFKYIGSRAATFFQAILNKLAVADIVMNNRTYFEDCVNNRFGCNTADNNNCTKNSNCN